MGDRKRCKRGVRAIPALAQALALAGLMAQAPFLGAEIIGEYSFELLADGTPLFSQALHWEPDPGVLYYEVTLQTAAGEPISVSKLEKPELRFSLGPGDYRYKIVFYNLLRKPELEIPWQDFTVMKAEIPRIEASEPKVWFLEGLQAELGIRGTDLIPGAALTLKREGGEPLEGAEPLELAGREIQREGTTVASFAFDPSELREGSYAIELRNPGGIEARLPSALLVRHKLPAPEGAAPEAGTVLGSAELRGMEALRFGWEAVPEATHYDFALYRAGEEGALVGPERLQALQWILRDLTLLDRGEYQWTVEALAMRGEEVAIPAAGALRSSFRIELPFIAAPTPKAGDVFYGR